jgi:hypothetical protein
VTAAEGFGKKRLFEILDDLEGKTRPINQEARERLAAEKGAEALEAHNISHSLAGAFGAHTLGFLVLVGSRFRGWGFAAIALQSAALLVCKGVSGQSGCWRWVRVMWPGERVVCWCWMRARDLGWRGAEACVGLQKPGLLHCMRCLVRPRRVWQRWTLIPGCAQQEGH